MSNISIRQLVAPFVGALIGWLAAHGFDLGPGASDALITLAAGLVGGVVHILEAKNPPAPPSSSSGASSSPSSSSDTSASSSPGAKVVKMALLALLAAPLLHGCASFGVAPPKSADESIAYGYGLYTAVEQGLSAALAAGQVDKATAAAVDTRAGQARALLDAARAAELVNPSGAATDLAGATQILTTLQAWLNNPKGALP